MATLTKSKSTVGRGNEQTLDMKEEILAGAVERRPPDVGHRDRIECRAQGVRVSRIDDASVREHHQVGVVDGDERSEKERLGVFEVLVEDLRDVLRIEPHVPGV